MSETQTKSNTQRGWIVATLILLGIVIAGVSFAGGYLTSNLRQSDAQSQADANTAAQGLLGGSAQSTAQTGASQAQALSTNQSTSAQKPAPATSYQAVCKDKKVLTYSSKTATACSGDGGLNQWI